MLRAIIFFLLGALSMHVYGVGWARFASEVERMHSRLPRFEDVFDASLGADRGAAQGNDHRAVTRRHRASTGAAVSSPKQKEREKPTEPIAEVRGGVVQESPEGHQAAPSPMVIEKTHVDETARPTTEEITNAIISEARRVEIPPELAVAVAAVESHFDPAARAAGSSALGLYQFTEATRRQYGIEDDVRFLRDWRLQVHLGVRHLARLREKFASSYVDVLLAYHVGAAAVRDGSIPPEAFRYVDRVLAEIERRRTT